MDNIFKVRIFEYCFSNILRFTSIWQDQIYQLNKFWDQMINQIDREEFTRLFVSDCNQINLPSHVYNIEQGFQLAVTEWRIGLMTLVANRIAQLYTDNIPDATQFVRWNPKLCRMEFLFEIDYMSF